LVPADKKIYALRDITATVECIPLIAASVMSKKIAAGAQAIVLDVKVGVGAFMETVDAARELARRMVAIGHLSGRSVVALLSDMNQPLGQAVGNALEVKEAINTLHNTGPADFREHCMVVASHMLVLGRKAPNQEQARRMAERALTDGQAWQKFRALVQAQGGDVRFIDQPDNLPRAVVVEEVSAPRGGWLREINARVVGETAVTLGAGREKKGDPIDHAVGIVIHRQVGDRVEQGQPLFSVHAKSQEEAAAARERLLAAHQWSDSECKSLPLFYDVIA
ncbi:MAG: thymidine phosphorylase, partial [Chloroflexi bacterium]